MAQDTISHFSHPGHELVKRHHFGPTYLCDMCWEHLTGPAYGCSADCDFAIHESCAGHPLTLTSPELHAHELVLVQTHKELVCDVCAGRCAPDSFLYRCPPCDFDMHPRCAQLPQTSVRSTQHPEHDLKLVLAEGSCAVCRHGAPAGGPRGWFYRCSACNFDLHVSCASGGGEAGINHVTPADALAAMHNNIQLSQALARIRIQGGRSVAELARPSSHFVERRRYF